MKCLRCKDEMLKEGLNNVLIDRCPRCGGVWLDRNELDRIVKNRRSKYKKDLFLDIKMEEHIEKRFPFIGDCQKCGGQIVFYERDDLILDKCLSCGGTFFDGNEIKMVLASFTFWGKVKSIIKNIVKRVKRWKQAKNQSQRES